MLRVLLLLLSLLVLVGAAYMVDVGTSSAELVAIAVNETGVVQVGSEYSRTASPFLLGTMLTAAIGITIAVILLLMTGIAGEGGGGGGGGIYVSR